MKVSVIIPTWQRHHLLLTRALPSVQAQIMSVECVVVSDGPDPHLAQLLNNQDVLYVEVDEHHEEGINVGGWARNKGLEVVTGDLIAYLDDDNSFRPDHIRLLSDKLNTSPVSDFVYSRMVRHGLGDVIGSVPPAFGTIDSSILMHRADTHKKFGTWPTPSGYAIDWELVESWLASGAKWAHVPEITVDYYWYPR